MKIDYNGIVRDMTPEEVAAYEAETERFKEEMAPMANQDSEADKDGN